MAGKYDDELLASVMRKILDPNAQHPFDPYFDLCGNALCVDGSVQVSDAEAAAIMRARAVVGLEPEP